MAKISILEQRGNENYFSELGMAIPTEKKLPKSKNRKKNYTGGNYEVRMPYMIIKNDRFTKFFKDPLSLYLYLRTAIIRGEMSGDIYNIKRKYYDEGFLACSFSYRQLADRFGISHNTVSKYIHKLQRLGVIRISKEWTSEKNSINVYILGTWTTNNDNKYETYFIEKVYGDNNYEN